MRSELEEIVRVAGEKAKEMQVRGIARNYKEGRDFATAADLCAQEAALEQLQRRFPQTAVLAEEQADFTVPSGDYFALDPIDGTVLYAQGGEQWGVSLAYLADGAPQCAAMYYPNLELMISAVRGGETLRNGEPVRLSVDGGLSSNLLGTDIGGWTDFERIERYGLPPARRAIGVRTLCSALGGALDLLGGVTCAYVHPGFAKIWDFAGCALAVESAGGYCCDLTGAPLAWNTLSMAAIFAASRDIAAEILETLPR